jgi:hypothetical protein
MPAAIRWFPSISIAVLMLPAAGRAAEPVIDFNRDIQPILADRCWSCHGRDKPIAGLKLSDRESALAPLENGTRAIVPGQPDESALIQRIESADPDTVMPPAEAQKPLTEQQKLLLRQWITAGAEYAPHWAFVAPKRPALPDVSDAKWPRNAIDRFILYRLEQEGISPSPAAEKEVWLRRVTLDLTGLPPSLEELDEFLADASDRAHEAVVDRLLESPRYAERMAMHWLDAARYADTNGYNNDETRTMWPWRDWVINAFATGMPYDQFLTEQLAGDLIPNATLPQQVATGFNRNHVLTTEGGIFEEEYHVEYVADRVHTTATVFLGLSLQCARCHDHKYDPISQKEYYQFAAFFNNVPDRIVGYNKGRMAEPLLKVPTKEQQAELAKLQSLQKKLEESLALRGKTVDPEIAKWEQSLTQEEIAKSGPVGLVASFSFEEKDGDQVADNVDPNRTAKILGKVARELGKFGQALDFQGQTHVDAGQIGNFDSHQPFSLAAWFFPASNDPTTILSKMDEANAYRGYDVILEAGKVACHVSHHWPDKAFKVVTKDAVPLNNWHHVAVTYDGSREAGGLRIYVDGQLQPLDVTTNNRLDGSLQTDKPFHIGRRTTSAPFQGRIDEVQVYATALTADDAAALAAGTPLSQLKDLLAVPAEKRNENQQQLLRAYYLDHVDAEAMRMKSELAAIPNRLAEIDKEIPLTMVMREIEPKRKIFVLNRGQYDQPKEEVTEDVPAVLSPLPADAPQNRLGFARWLASPAHPLTARVAVNRWWELLFGTGIVETAEDFGIQGALPSHPELLDWLATELVAQNWDQRAILKAIVLSAAYRQSSHVTPELLERDPRNRLITRGPRYRLPAETVRDHALFVSGLLKEHVGGPSVKPYQPEGLWEDVSVERRDKYVVETGDNIYRRSMYTFWKRTCPPPTMSAFDAPDRETCVIRRARTNTPLQALVLMNDPTYIEAARKLAERIQPLGDSAERRLQSAYRLVVSRLPSAQETAVMLRLRDAARQRFDHDADAAAKLLSIGQSPRDEQYEPADLAAWTAVCTTLLNLDEAISKP